MDKAIVTLSFDDGRKDTYDVFFNLLEPLGISATVNIPTGYIETHFSDTSEIGYNGLMTKEELDRIYECDLFEIAGHGYMHKNDNNDVEKGINKLREWYPTLKQFGFASPHSYMKDTEVIEKDKYYKSLGIRYIRLGRNFSRKNYYKRILSLIASRTGSIFSFLSCYISSLNDGNDYLVHAIPIIKTTKLSQVKAIINYSIKKKKWCILELHGIDDPGNIEYQELFCWKKEDFAMLCEYLSKLREKGLIEILNAIDVIEKNIK